jgi:hypothetical protein
VRSHNDYYQYYQNHIYYILGLKEVFIKLLYSKTKIKIFLMFVPILLRLMLCVTKIYQQIHFDYRVIKTADISHRTDSSLGRLSIRTFQL